MSIIVNYGNHQLPHFQSNYLHLHRVLKYTMPKFYIALSVFLFVCGFSQGQNTLPMKSTKRFYVQPKFQLGLPIVYSDSLTSSIKKTYYSQELKIGFQTQGNHGTQYSLNFPTYGFGIYHAQLSDPDTLGNPFAAYAFFNSPFVNKERIKFAWEIGFGLAWHFQTFDFQTNPRNDAISTELNIIFNLNLSTSIKLSERFDAVVDADFTHFSNGSVKMPNKGLNLYSFGLGLNYHFANKTANFKRFDPKTISKPKAFNKRKQLDVFIASGVKTTRRDLHIQPKYLTSSLCADYGIAYNYIGVFSLGMDLFYDATLHENVTNYRAKSEFSFMMLGAHISHELMVSNFSLVTQLGTYLQKTMDVKGNFYLRVGLRYTIARHYFLNLSLKTQNGFKADYIEFGMGYRIFKN